MGAIGAFTFVLHSHLPYARLAGRWPHGEEWIHEAASDTYIPLLETLNNLKRDGVPFRLTISITPTLAEQLLSPDVLDHFDQYLNEKIKLAQSDIDYFATRPSIDPQYGYLAQWYKNWYETVRTAFHDHYNRDIIGAYRCLQDEGLIEIITSAATHAYLPLLSQDSSIVAQLKVAIVSHERIFGRKPRGIWLPECAYRPAYIDGENKRAGLETFLKDEGLQFFFSETHTITGGSPVGVAMGEVIGPYGEIKRRYVIPTSDTLAKKHSTTFRPYFVSESRAGMDAKEHSGVSVIARNNNTGQQVWSSEWGYPGDFDYREFHKKSGTSGLQYWRVTGAKTDLAHKDLYHPDWAAYKIDQHAEHFAHLVGDLLRDFNKQTGQVGIIASSYDTDLFGHWWFEGVKWLEGVLRHLAENDEVVAITAGDYLIAHPPTEALHIPESSWGVGGGHFSWDNGETHWMWPYLHEAEERMQTLAAANGNAAEDMQVVLNQAARELMLAQSSDWPFLITTGQAREYAIQRFSHHLERFEKLASSVESGRPNRALADEYWEIDKLFPDIDYRWFKG